MKCAICGITVESIDEAVEEGWTPYFYDGDKEHEFACSGCSQAILRVDDNGEMEVKDEFRGKMKYLEEWTTPLYPQHGSTILTRRSCEYGLDTLRQEL